jgi:hypothetical protein
MFPPSLQNPLARFFEPGEGREMYRDGLLLLLLLACIFSYFGFLFFESLWYFTYNEDHYIEKVLPKNLTTVPLMLELFTICVSLILFLSSRSQALKAFSIFICIIVSAYTWWSLPSNLFHDDGHYVFYHLYDYPAPQKDYKVSLYFSTRQEPYPWYKDQYHLYVVVLHGYDSYARTLYVISKNGSCGIPFINHEKQGDPWTNTSKDHPIHWINPELIQVGEEKISIHADREKWCL